MNDTILTLNAGSSSLKFAIFRAADLVCQAEGQVAGVGMVDGSVLTIRSFLASGEASKEARELNGVTDHSAALHSILSWIRTTAMHGAVAAIGHRVVHGGTYFKGPALVSPETMRKIVALSALAPLHQPHNIAGIEAASRAFPGLPQVACFDTAFHQDHPFVEDVYALPLSLYGEGIRRYGFHGLSYEFVVSHLRSVAPEAAAGRVIACHLGSGASICGLRDGRSISSTMGFSPLDGLPMGTRCGQIDAAVVLHLMTTKGMDVSQVADLLYRRSGLLGLSGISADMRELEASNERAARQAIDYFVARACREIGGMAAAIGGVDILVFTGGVGENSSHVRGAILGGLGWLGVALDADANSQNQPTVTKPRSKVAALIVKANEELMIAKHTMRLAFDCTISA